MMSKLIGKSHFKNIKRDIKTFVQQIYAFEFA